MHRRVLGALLIMLAFWGALNFALRTPATEIPSLVDSPAYLRGSQASPKGNIVSVSKSSPTQDSVFETGSISEADIAPIPLPLRKPARVTNVANGKVATPNQTTQKRTASVKKRPHPKQMP
jgi:hypothetical protein